MMTARFPASGRVTSHERAIRGRPLHGPRELALAAFFGCEGGRCGERAYLDRQPFFRDYPRLLIHETGVHFVDTFRYLLIPNRTSG
jgi:hypothetical protein